MIGFSGAGKSTLVRLVNQLERPSSGKVLIDGQDMSQVSSGNFVALGAESE